MHRVLVVDDVETYRKYLALALEDEDYAVRTATGSRKAVEVGREFKPDILVVDWMLDSDMNGMQVATALSGENPGMQTVLITGYPSPDLKREVLKSRIASFVEKPFTLADIVDAVGKLCGRPARSADEG